MDRQEIASRLRTPYRKRILTFGATSELHELLNAGSPPNDKIDIEDNARRAILAELLTRYLLTADRDGCRKRLRLILNRHTLDLPSGLPPLEEWYRTASLEDFSSEEGQYLKTLMEISDDRRAESSVLKSAAKTVLGLRRVHEPVALANVLFLRQMTLEAGMDGVDGICIPFELKEPGFRAADQFEASDTSDFIVAARKAEYEAYRPYEILVDRFSSLVPMSRKQRWIEEPLLKTGTSAYFALLAAFRARANGVMLSAYVAFIGGLDEDTGAFVPVAGLAAKIRAALAHGIRAVVLTDEIWKTEEACSIRNEYESILEFHRFMGSSRDAAKLDSLIDSLNSRYTLDCIESCLPERNRKAIRLNKRLTDLTDRLQSLLRNIDNPANADSHADLERVKIAIEEEGVSNSYIRALMALTEVGDANNRGDARRAREVWEEYKDHSKTPSAEMRNDENIGLELDLINRAAVSMMDRFDFRAAISVLADSRRIWEDMLPDKIRGEWLGTEGQAHACLGNYPASERAFRSALRIFERIERTKDANREWSYLGHLACDMGPEKGRQLYDGVSDQLAWLKNPIPEFGSEDIFRTILWLKTKFVYAGRDWLEIVIGPLTAKPDLDSSEEMRSRRQFGQVLQLTGMIFEKHWSLKGSIESLDLAEEQYKRARDFFGEHSEELVPNLLSHLASARLQALRARAGRKTEIEAWDLFERIRDTLSGYSSEILSGLDSVEIGRSGNSPDSYMQLAKIAPFYYW